MHKIIIGLVLISLNLTAQTRYINGNVDRTIFTSKYKLVSNSKISKDATIVSYEKNKSYAISYQDNKGSTSLFFIKGYTNTSKGVKYRDCSSEEYYYVEDDLESLGTLKLTFIERYSNGDYLILNFYNLKKEE